MYSKSNACRSFLFWLQPEEWLVVARELGCIRPCLSHPGPGPHGHWVSGIPICKDQMLEESIYT